MTEPSLTEQHKRPIEGPAVVLIGPPRRDVQVVVVLDAVNIFFLRPGTTDATAILTMDLTTLKALQRDINLNLPVEAHRG